MRPLNVEEFTRLIKFTPVVSEDFGSVRSAVSSSRKFPALSYKAVRFFQLRFGLYVRYFVLHIAYTVTASGRQFMNTMKRINNVFTIRSLPAEGHSQDSRRTSGYGRVALGPGP